jgi:hypothetical protein
MISSSKIGAFGLVLLFVGIVVMLYTTPDTRITKAGGYIEALSYCAFVIAAMAGRKWWLLLLLFSPMSYFLWLLAQGH